MSNKSGEKCTMRLYICLHTKSDNLYTLADYIRNLGLIILDVSLPQHAFNNAV
jgi:hypothetical protein